MVLGPDWGLAGSDLPSFWEEHPEFERDWKPHLEQAMLTGVSTTFLTSAEGDLVLVHAERAERLGDLRLSVRPLIVTPLAIQHLREVVLPRHSRRDQPA